ncbi:MAG: LicD family protein [Streptococcaceae bacterium]|nr:LicD family protein [Streptococcaceae bacterium]
MIYTGVIDMIPISTEKVRALQLDMVSYIDGICRDAGIDYSLAAGSLLGSIKYQGYIPWDDDIDIMLTRPNYEKLMKALMTDLPDVYQLSYYKACETYLPFAKLYDARTTYKSRLDHLNPVRGVFIDIFPIDSLPNDPAIRKHFKSSIQYAVTNLITSCDHGLAYASSEHWYYALAKLILWAPSHRRNRGNWQELAEEADLTMQAHNTLPDSDYCNYVYNPRGKSGNFPKSLFERYEDCPFEGLTLRRLTDYDAYLTELYGDYKRTPKPHEQHNHSYYRYFWRKEEV